MRNLFISDGSQFSTSAAPNPTLTIVALPIRQADCQACHLTTNGLSRVNRQASGCTIGSTRGTRRIDSVPPGGAVSVQNLCVFNQSEFAIALRQRPG